jgi:hypothetical protein
MCAATASPVPFRPARDLQERVMGDVAPQPPGRIVDPRHPVRDPQAERDGQRVLQQGATDRGRLGMACGQIRQRDRRAGKIREYQIRRRTGLQH